MNLKGTLTLAHSQLQKAVGSGVNAVEIERVLGASLVNVKTNGALHILSNDLSRHV